MVLVKRPQLEQYLEGLDLALGKRLQLGRLEWNLEQGLVLGKRPQLGEDLEELDLALGKRLQLGRLEWNLDLALEEGPPFGQDLEELLLDASLETGRDAP